MANTFQFSSNSTFDDELDRYAEAAETEQSSIGLNPNVVKKRVYNQETNTTDLFASISGGFVKIGEEPLSALADLERYDQSLRSMGVAPTADDFYAAGFDDAVISESGILEPSALTVMPVDGPPNDARFAEFQSIMGTADAGPTMADYEAAGFTPDEVSTFQTQAFEATMPADAMVPTPLNQDQIDQYVKEEDSEYVSRQPGLPEIAVTQAANIVSEVGKGLARGIIVNPANFVKDFFGLYDPLALQFFHPQTGEFDPKILFMSREEKAALDEKMAAGEMPYAASLDEIIASDPETLVAGLAGGIAQFVGAYVGLGKLFRMNKGLVASAGRGAAADFLAFSGDEGRLTDVLVQMGVSDAYIPDFFKTDPNDPDYIGRFKTALEGAALGAMVEIIGPLFRAIKNGDMSPKAVSQLLTDGRQKAQRFMVQQIDGAEQRVATSGDITIDDLAYNEKVRKSSGALDRDTVLENDNILYRPERAYRFIGKLGYADFLENGIIRAAQNTKKGYQDAYFMKGKSSSRYGRGDSGAYIVETAPVKGAWRNDDASVYITPNSPLTADNIRIYKRKENGSYEVVLDNIGDRALLPAQPAPKQVATLPTRAISDKVIKNGN
jgi:hypothetical protein